MKKSADRRIVKLAEQLEVAKVDREKIDQIMEGGETIIKSIPPEKKAEWLGKAMARMDKLLDLSTRKAVREGCACRVGRRTSKVSQGIAKDNATLEARITAQNKLFMVFGGSVWMQENDEIMVRFAPEGLERYRCSCLPKAEKPLSVTYCYCGGGSVKHHLQISLGRKLDCTTLSSALSSGGKLPCTFSFRIKE
jgi:hypothetical protein